MTMANMISRPSVGRGAARVAHEGERDPPPAGMAREQPEREGNDNCDPKG